ncbi:hypothetical protein SteCoe_17021 [Stentor coeruleus]|uniref:Uncharacterized protein n=1 Tax=Stentor coeruleus TaxID=5963 RepID=A0A1R2C005_9CILI|nr:hypothetical protein SteCoe_17021 [Stentor coeruleus]
MEGNSKKLMIEILKLASMFCNEASELISGYVRREEILSRDSVSKGVKIGENDKKNERTEKMIEKSEKKIEKVEKKVEKTEKVEKNEKVEKVEEKKKSSKKRRKYTNKQNSGYHLFLKCKSQEIKSRLDYKNLQVDEILLLVSKQWANLDSTEREIWDEKSKENETEKTKVVEILPKKTPRNEEPEKSKKSKKKPKSPSSNSGTDSEPSENLKKKKKSSE